MRTPVDYGFIICRRDDVGQLARGKSQNVMVTASMNRSTRVSAIAQEAQVMISWSRACSSRLKLNGNRPSTKQKDALIVTAPERRWIRKTHGAPLKKNRQRRADKREEKGMRKEDSRWKGMSLLLDHVIMIWWWRLWAEYRRCRKIWKIQR